jgi:hypothetical protein
MKCGDGTAASGHQHEHLITGENLNAAASTYLNSARRGKEMEGRALV